MHYAITVHEEAGHYWSKCDDIPEAHSAGDTLEELVANAVDGLRCALTIYVDQLREIPPASPAKPGQLVVPLPALVYAKIELWNAMRAKGMRKADLVRLLRTSQTAVDRLVDFEHSSKLEAVEQALAALGRGLQVTAMDTVPTEYTVTYKKAGASASKVIYGMLSDLQALMVLLRLEGISYQPSPDTNVWEIASQAGLNDVSVRRRHLEERP
ncbi:type II toxin-antitoxin system HicB family antitoxin [Pseudomonas oryzihabitans]|uniref:type II toxin-antitoxin system HicB family antitoxin n=1 Tax=Pseudomonas oryzihabitans TaxID=47885 RepID=UPI00241ECEF4|nr:type II toxin-antitoxin system HicB family antitoxin [Pseudomonas oryzihabitans]